MSSMELMDRYRTPLRCAVLAILAMALAIMLYDAYARGINYPAYVPFLDWYPLFIWVWGPLLLAYGGVFWLSTRSSAMPQAIVRLLLILQGGLVLLMIAVRSSRSTSLLLAGVAWQIGLAMSWPKAVLWVVVQSVGEFIILRELPGPDRGLLVLLDLIVQLLALGAAYMARAEAKGREQLAQVNAELRATRFLLQENAKVAERMRVARDLHDVMGHSLTGLALQLEVAAKLADKRIAVPISRAKTVAHDLLQQVRDVVGGLRGNKSNLADALRQLAMGIEDVAINLDVPDDLHLDSERFTTVLRCVQEAITNTRRHSRATRLCFVMRQQNSNLIIHVKDDGIGALQIVLGHGLIGMKERLEALHGKLVVTSEPGQGFALDIILPLEAI